MAVTDTKGRLSLVRSFKNVRNAIVDGYFRSRRAKDGLNFAQSLAQSGARRVCVTIAYNTPWVLDILTRAWQLFPPGMVLVVVDNSSAKAARAQNRAICQARGVPYIELPWNPEWHPNRSHGISMNWAYYNIISHLQPETFGFIDHDCFPLGPFDLGQRLESADVYGLRWLSTKIPGGWYLWAGYCFFRYETVRGRHIDFKHRIEFGMDTGGGNWPDVYSRMAPERALAAAESTLDIAIDGKMATYMVLDGAMFHVGGASYSDAYAKESHRKLLSNHIWDTYLGGTAERIVKDV